MQDIVDQVGLLPVLTVVVLLVVFVVTGIVTWWKLYTKAGQAGWKYIVPVYNTVMMARIAKIPEKYGWLAGVLSILGSLNHPVAFFFYLGYLVSIFHILRSLIKQYDAPLSFWLYAVLLPIVAVFRVDGVKYIGAQQVKGANKPKE